MKNLVILLTFIYSFGFSQPQSKSVLFLGNSYTGFNDLPLMLFEVATSCGDDLIYDSNAPGGYTLQGHSTNSTTLSKIASGNWDYVVLQEQSQLPSFPIGQVQASVFPYARKLDSLIIVNNPCAETVFYMTWGRKNGDSYNCPNWPPVCTYKGMDSLLNLRYRMMADTNNAIISPVGAVWNHIRNNYPNIELYDPDESHPSVAGTFAAACTFYTSIFRNDPGLVGFNPGLSSADADNIKQAVNLIVYQDLAEWHIGDHDPTALFSSSQTGPLEISFTNLSENSSSYQWFFGDGSSSNDPDPVHTYPSPGTYQCSLISAGCGRADTTLQTIIVNAVSISEMKNDDYPITIENNELTIQNDAGTAITYQIFSLLGALVYSGRFEAASEKVDLSGFSEGLYIVRLEINGSMIQKRFFK